MNRFRTILTKCRTYSCYKSVPRPESKPLAKPESFKLVNRPAGSDDKPLIEQLAIQIKAAGPLTVAEYMRQVLTNPAAGYYMQKDVFGQKGDFITSPDISQLFGEMIAVWLVNELTKIGNPRPLQLIELGPGRGSLMSDVLRVLNHFKFTNQLSVHLVEVSPYLSSVQAQKLCVDSDVVSGVSPYTPCDPHKSFYQSGLTQDGIQIYWYQTIEEIPREFSVVLAHEFFDALPIHKFQKTESGWKEVLIDLSREDDSKFVYTLSGGETPMSKLFIKPTETREHVEVCPEAAVMTQHIAQRLEEDGGISLFVDYGHNGNKTDTFRAFKKHQLHDPLIDPGSADLTADVDFSLLKEAVKNKVLALGPVSQGEFLKRVGIETRLKLLLQTVDSAEAEHLRSGYDMIVSENQMGERFKFFSMFPLVLKDHLNKFPVSGFSDSPTM